MKTRHPSIFREAAIRHYASSRDETVLPRWVSPQTFLYLWFLVGLMLLGSAIAWLAKVPVSASGSAIVVRSSHGDRENQNRLVIALFFPAQPNPNLHQGQKVLLQFEGIQDPQGQHRFSRTLLAVEPTLLSPEAAQKQFNLTAGNAATLVQPVAVAIAPLAPLSKDLPTSVCLGSRGKAEVVVGSQRLLALFPLIGPLFEPLIQHHSS